MISRNFIKASAIYTLAGALPMASALLLVPFYMADLTTANFGALSICLAFSILVQLLVTYSFDSSLYIHYHEFKNDKEKLSRFVSSAFVLMLFIGLGLAIILLPTGAYILSWFSDGKDLAFFPNGWLALGGGVFQALFKVHSNFLQSREKPETFFWANLLLFSAIFVLTLLGLKVFPQTLIGPLGGRFVALGLGSVWVLFRIFREYGFHFDLPLLGTSFSFNFYSFIYQIQQWFINYFDRIVMMFYLPLASVGVYDFAIKSLVGVELVMNGLHSALIPRVLKLVNIRETKGTSPEINRYYHGFIAVLMIVACGAIWLVPMAIEWLSNFLEKPGYSLSTGIVPYIAVLYICRSVRLFFGLPYSILKYTKPLPVIYAVVAIVKIGGMFLLIPYLGVMGVIASTAASVLTEILMLYFLSKHRFVFKFNAYKILIAPVALTLLVCAGELTGVLNADLRHFIYCMLAVMMLGFVYRFELKNLKSAVRAN
ncbi:MAG TPA: lipopolysaccharide biosynthesis protein [Cyclobacteriaceae bacterium]|nr:lipopolysaccharide biosynthesis protein [Cyclobacteriaceae bacterium]HMV08565.1 lipopolysaccharide biosynthesis protein [Cyclobacteriaceae bacterium]HMV91106.1 lipopolysaccharide biosynthesis protein [Cyclobacteriaceae bacterium]HMX00226.1 lipopolysaccharide biosynthesis protein [Cyclobacteriaceae bacterium]HMX49775.1 lipopolysaccharide biosynthesis protein [Cyclobacteriaceae bacterium]